MNAESIASIAAAVVALTQLLKWGGIPDKLGPLAVMILAALGVGLWGYSTEPAYGRSLVFTYFAAWIMVATSAAGIFGFTRAAGSAVIAAKAPPPGGAGSERTVDASDRQRISTAQAPVSDVTRGPHGELRG